MKLSAKSLFSALFVVAAPFLGASASTKATAQVYQCGCAAYGPQGEKSFESELSTWPDGSLSFMCTLAGRRFIDRAGTNHTDHYEKQCTEVGPEVPVYECWGVAECSDNGNDRGFGRAQALSFFNDDPHQAAYRRAYEVCSVGHHVDDYTESCTQFQ